MSRILFVSVVIFLSGCATDNARREVEALFARGQYEQGLAALEEGSKNHKENVSMRTALAFRRAEAITKLFSLALEARTQGKEDVALSYLDRLLKIDAANERGLALKLDIERERRHQLIVKEALALMKADKPDLAVVALERGLRENPKHPEMLELRTKIEAEQRRKLDENMYQLAETAPISLEFRDASLKMILEAISRNTHINFVFDKDVRSDLLATIFLRQATLEDALNLLAATNQLQTKILNPTTVLVYPNTPDKKKEYQDLLLKGFFLANADVKSVAAQLKTVMKFKDMIVDEKLNLIIMRDTPNAVRVAERIIDILDIGEPEVMLEVEVLEVNRSRLLDLGIQFPDQLTLTPIAPTGSSLTLESLRNLNSPTIGVSTPSLTINLKRELADANILANPRIRAKNKEKAKILIGDRIPVISTTATSTGFVSENIQYAEVGIKLEVEPAISVDGTVGIKIGMEVSSIAKEVRTASGSLAYQIGTRNANTVLRLNDGETQILAGLISDEDRTSAHRVPGLGDLPLLGRLFGSTNDSSHKSEIVLSITPRIVRNLRRPDLNATEFWSGTEAAVSLRPLALPITPSMRMSQQLSLGSSVAGLKFGEKNLLQADSSKDERKGAVEQTAVKKAQLSWAAPSELKVGEESFIALRIKTEAGLKSFPLQIHFDPAILQVLDAEEGGFFQKGNGATSFSRQISAAEGNVLVGIARNGGDVVTGDEVLVSFIVRANKAGKAVMQVLSASPLGVTEGSSPVDLPLPLVMQAK